MMALTFFPLLTIRRLAAFAAFAFALIASGTVVAEISFVDGKVRPKEFKGSDTCKTLLLEDFEAFESRLSGTWRQTNKNYIASGKVDVFVKNNEVVVEFWGSDVESSKSRTKLVGRDIHVEVDLFYVSFHFGNTSVQNCVLSFVLAGVISDDAPTIAEAPSPSPTLSQTSEAQKREAERLAKLKAAAEERAKQKAEAESKRKAEEAAGLKAEAELRRIVEEAKLKAEPERKQKPEAKQNTAGIGGKLKQQLAFLKNLKEEGLIDDQEFNTKKSALLNRYLGLKQSPPSQTPSTRSSKTVDIAKLNEFSDVEFGKYYALVIGSNNYKHLPKLKTAKNDAEAVAKILRDKYSFEVSLMTDASHDDILDAFDEYREKLGYSDNLLIYYAGHGWLDEAGDQGYWLPVDAKKNRRSKWISVASVTTAIKSLDANHVMVVADSCFSGTLVRGLKITERRTDYIRRMVDKRARVVLTSGGLEPVADSDGSGHSPFAKAFIQVLNDNDSVMDGTGLFTNLRRTVVLNSDQTPEYGDVRKAGHEGGDFLFVRKK